MNSESGTAISKNGRHIRLTEERWAHITEEHCELAGLQSEVLKTITNPVRIVAGGEGELRQFANWTWANTLLSCIVN